MTDHPSPHPMIVTETPTIMDGRVVRWFRDEHDEKTGEPLVSASRNGVQIAQEMLTGADEAAVASAFDVHRRLVNGPDRGHGADLTDVITHRRRGLFASSGLEAVR